MPDTSNAVAVRTRDVAVSTHFSFVIGVLGIELRAEHLALQELCDCGGNRFWGYIMRLPLQGAALSVWQGAGDCRCAGTQPGSRTSVDHQRRHGDSGPLSGGDSLAAQGVRHDAA